MILADTVVRPSRRRKDDENAAARVGIFSPGHDHGAAAFWNVYHGHGGKIGADACVAALPGDGSARRICNGVSDQN